MSEEIREQISALVDEELSELERPLLLGRLQRDPALRACLGRYQLIGEAIRGARLRAGGRGVAERVQAALADEAAPRRRVPAPRGWKPLAGLAVAASVAWLAVLSLRPGGAPESGGAPRIAQQAPAVAARVADVAAPEAQWKRLDPELERRLDRYLVNHNEYAASRGVSGVLPYVRIVGYEGGQ